MSTTISPVRRHELVHPALAAGAGFSVWAAAMLIGWQTRPGDSDDPLGLTEALGYVGVVTPAIVLAVWLASRALAAGPRRIASTSLGLAIAAAATWIGFWSGWPIVFAAVAVLLAVEYHRRIGSLSGQAAVGLALGVVAGVAATAVCIVG